jgi:hypothetical protein
MLRIANPDLLEASIRGMTADLLRIARQLTYNCLSDNSLYIFSEILPIVLTERERFLQLEKTQPVPQQLAAIMPQLLAHYADFYDINLFIHKAERKRTVIDIRYYAKSSLGAAQRQLAAADAPMLHGKVPIPFWASHSTLKFDINWKVYAPVSRLKQLWLTQQWRVASYLTRCIS